MINLQFGIMGRILTKREVNEINICIAVLLIEKTSFQLRMLKIWKLFDILRFGGFNLEFDKGMSIQEMVQKTLDEVPDFVKSMNKAVRYRNADDIKKIILRRLIEIEAYKSIVDLNLEKIKL